MSREQDCLHTDACVPVVPLHSCTQYIPKLIRHTDGGMACDRYRTAVEDVPKGEYTIPLGKAKIKRKGNDITLVGWGQQVAVLEKAVRLPICFASQATAGLLCFLPVVAWHPQYSNVAAYPACRGMGCCTFELHLNGICPGIWQSTATSSLSHLACHRTAKAAPASPLCDSCQRRDLQRLWSPAAPACMQRHQVHLSG